MPIVVAHPILRDEISASFRYSLGETKFLLPISKIFEKYEYRCNRNTKINCYISRIFNEELRVVLEPQIYQELTMIKPASDLYLDVDRIAMEYSIPSGYIIEILAMSFTGEMWERTIFPHEIRIDALFQLADRLETEKENFREISHLFEASLYLRNLGLNEISIELNDGHNKFKKGDTDGAIKAYRKVIEGFRNHLREKDVISDSGKKEYKHLIDQSENRTDAVIDFLSKTYHLLSNFGEHIGTRAFDEEGIFAKKLVDGLTEYLSKKFNK